MEHLDQEFKKLARKTKIKRWVMTTLIALVSAAVLLIGSGYIAYFQAEKNNKAMWTEFDQVSTLFSPNFVTSYSDADYSGIFSGEVAAVRTKNVDGYPVYLGEVTGKFDVLGYRTSLHGAGFESESKSNPDNGIFEKTSKEKIPQFYNSKVTDSTYKATTQLAYLAEMDDYVGELAVTFNKSYSYEEIWAMIPENLLISWYWLTPVADFDPNAADNFNILGIRPLSAAGDETITTKTYQNYLAKAKAYATRIKEDDQGAELYGRPDLSNIEHVLADYPTLADAKFSGVILTGKTENFKQLADVNWIYATSIGSVVERVPYIDPIK